MPLRTTVSRTWNAVIVTLRLVARVGVGLLGAYRLLGGTIGVVVAAVELAWVPLANAGLFAFIGWVLAYGAFHHWPWNHSRFATERLVRQCS